MPDERIHVYELTEALPRGGPGRAHRGRVAEVGGPLEPGTPVLVRSVARADAGDDRVLSALVQAHAAARRIESPWVQVPVDHGLSSGPAGRCFWSVAPWAEGRLLSEVLAGTDFLPDLLTESVVSQVAEALAAAHAAGVAGLGLSPETILLREDGSALLLDPGFGPAAGLRWPRDGKPPAAMMAACPEVLAGAPPDAAADLFALGAILHRCMTGAWHRPEDARALLASAADMDAVRPDDVRPQCSFFLCEVAFALARAERCDRIPTADALVKILRERRRSAWWQSLRIDQDTCDAGAPSRRAALREPPPPPIPEPAAPVDPEWWDWRLDAVPDRPSHAARCVARDAEIAVLEDSVRRLRPLGGHVVLLPGPAGSGKTRVVDAFLDRLRDLPPGRRPAVLHGGNRRVGIGRPLGAFTEALTDWVHRSRIVDAHDVAPLLGEATGIAAAFAAVLSSEDAPPAFPPIPREGLAPAYLRCLRTIASKRPVVLVAEDVHWADPEALELLSYLARAGADLPLLLVATYRPDEVAPARRRGVERLLASVRGLPGTREIPVGPFDGARLAELAREIVEPADLASELAARVHATLGGAPGALLETVAALAAEGALVPATDGRLAPGSGWSAAGIPASVPEAVRRRLAPLPPREIAFLEAASVQGVTFDADVARIASGLDGDAAAECADSLARRGILAGQGVARRFASHAVFDHVHASLDDATLADRHEATAAAYLESRNPDQLPPSRIHGMLSYRVAWHYLLAGREARGLLYARAAIEHLRETFRDGDGERLTALACRTLAADPARGADLLDLLLDRARFLGAQGRVAEQREVLDEALLRSRERRDLPRESRILLENASAKQALGDAAAADHDARQALACAHRAGETETELRVHLWLAQGAAREQRWGHARAHYAEALEIARRREDAVTEADVRHGLGAVALAIGAFDQADEELHVALSAHRRRGDLAREAETLTCLGSLANAVGDPVRAEGTLRRALAIRLALGDGAGETRVLGLLAMTLQENGALVEARAAHWACLERARFLDSGPTAVVALVNLATVDAFLGRLEEARDEFGEALRGARELRDERLQGYAMTGLGEVARQTGRTDVARGLLDRAAGHFRAAADPSGLAAALLAAGRIEVFAGENEKAKSLLLEAYRLAEQQNARQVSALAHALLALLAARRGDGDDAERRLAEAGIALSEIRASDATRIELSFVHSLVLRVLGRPAEAVRRLFHAEATVHESVRALPEDDRDRVLSQLSPCREILAGADAARVAEPVRAAGEFDTVQV